MGHRELPENGISTFQVLQQAQMAHRELPPPQSHWMSTLVSIDLYGSRSGSSYRLLSQVRSFAETADAVLRCAMCSLRRRDVWRGILEHAVRQLQPTPLRHRMPGMHSYINCMVVPSVRTALGGPRRAAVWPTRFRSLHPHGCTVAEHATDSHGRVGGCTIDNRCFPAPPMGWNHGRGLAPGGPGTGRADSGRDHRVASSARNDTGVDAPGRPCTDQSRSPACTTGPKCRCPPSDNTDLAGWRNLRRWQWPKALSFVVACESGKYSMGGSANCDTCQAGRYSEAGQGNCSVCNPGRFSQDGNTCAACESGKYSMGGSANCDTCQAGRYSEAGQGNCSVCNPGRFSQDGNTCAACESGKYSMGGSANCDTCQAGRDSEAGQGNCSACNPGRLSQDGNTCAACEPGTYSMGGSADCDTCQAGKYSKTESADCSECNPGDFTQDGKTCAACKSGKYSICSSVSCETCQAGRYSEAGWANCSACDSGYFTQDGQICTACEPGKHSDAGSVHCYVCEAGTFSRDPSESNQGCVLCSAGKFSQSEGSSVCDECVSGDYSKAGAQKCETCSVGCTSPAAATANLSGCICLERTYWSDTVTNGSAGPNRIQIACITRPSRPLRTQWPRRWAGRCSAAISGLTTTPCLKPVRTCRPWRSTAGRT